MYKNDIKIKLTEGSYNFSNFKNIKLAIVASRFNSIIVDNLINGCLSSLTSLGISYEQLEIIYVPGAMELPLAVQNIINKPEITGIIALGAVIRGATPHFEYVAGECSSGLARLSLEYNKPVGFGVLTTDTVEQAIERAGCKSGNKGSDAAFAVLNMIDLIIKLKANQ
ncbi:MAG: 6,7-dimethyl-8-ribityllumazine synthase [Gammaproteobacteria bacterium]|nr:6,7-dimethyl-8-ribityllumazine synthase [Gammaproteobacteria bacterium]